ncbi:hypothetical protein NPIL_302331 [Nephila pilipes]|uniref:Uncharacterized protein n=1 Tax=Nephila pilipes TaxID=299642 RepID=A0A8X6QB85_NEPPI|nr:hypothetical protein NPIL_302331 [Nephila pilipes]
MYSIEQEFPSLTSLTSLSISKAEISFIHPKVFRGLTNLRMLILQDNEISEMSRSMLPNPAKELYMIDLSGNRLSSFPPNMFINMPNLKELELNNNHFVTLDEDTFRWPFENLKSLMFKGK